MDGNRISQSAANALACPDQESCQAGSSHLLLKLLFSPFQLVDVAVRLSSTRAVILGLTALYVMNSAFWGIGGAGVGEPYRDLYEYLEIILQTGPLFGLLTTPFFGVIVFGLAILAADSPRYGEVGARIFVLGPVTILVPFLVCSVFSALDIVADPDFGLTRTAKPAWIESPIIPILGGDASLLGLLALWVSVYVVAFARLCRVTDAAPDRLLAECKPE
jgi:hypothetical protein